MTTKRIHIPLTVMAMIVLIAVLYAGDKKKPAQVIRLNTEAFSTNTLSTTKADLVYKINTDPRYSHLSPSEKVKEIARWLKNKKGQFSQGKSNKQNAARGIKRPSKRKSK